MGLWQSLKRLNVIQAGAGLIAVSALVSGGCETKSFLDPSELGRFNHKPTVVPILRHLDTGFEEPDTGIAQGQDPRPEDLVARPTDYTIGPNDLVQVTIGDLIQQGLETTKASRVTESGYISLPMIGQVKAAGLTEAQLEQSITQAYRDRNLLQNAQVSVVTVEARNKSFTIGGAVTAPGQYAIVDSNFRLYDALVLARDVTSQTGIEYVYIVRKKSQDLNAEGTAPAATPAAPGTQPSPDLFAPRSEAPAQPSGMGAPGVTAEANTPSTMPATGTEGRTVTVEGQPMQIQGGQMVPAAGGNAPAAGQATASTQPSEPGTFEFNDLREPDDKRVIRVPLPALQRLELKYNVVIRPGDFIYVPQPLVGEYYLGGHVARTGVYSLTAREITLRMAIIGAGGLDQMAIPERTDIVRKLGHDHEIYSRVNLAKVFSGEEPDIMLKPDDQVMVGTNALAPFLAAIRGGFRITYGFGFLYDRNFNTNNNNGIGG